MERPNPEALFSQQDIDVLEHVLGGTMTLKDAEVLRSLVPRIRGIVSPTSVPVVRYRVDPSVPFGEIHVVSNDRQILAKVVNVGQ